VGAVRGLEARVRAIYGRHEHHIVPYVGAAFERPTDDVLRVMAVGINSYVSPPDWAAIAPTWFRDWFAEGTHRHQRAVRRASTALASAVSGPGGMFEGLKLEDGPSFYVTNAIKVYLPEARGKRADDLVDADFEKHVAQWHDELLAVAEHGALPHVLVVFGAPFWKEAWQTLHPKGRLAERLGVKAFTAGADDLLHFLNRVELERADARHHDLLLVRLRHPSARTKVGSVKWLVEQPGFRPLVARTSISPTRAR
jgi:hypothetical protein